MDWYEFVIAYAALFALSSWFEHQDGRLRKRIIAVLDERKPKLTPLLDPDDWEDEPLDISDPFHVSTDNYSVFDRGVRIAFKGVELERGNAYRFVFLPNDDQPDGAELVGTLADVDGYNQRYNNPGECFLKIYHGNERSFIPATLAKEIFPVAANETEGGEE